MLLVLGYYLAFRIFILYKNSPFALCIDRFFQVILFVDLKRGEIMLTVFCRTIILILFIVFALRIMGKRQIGQLQPSEFVVTILLSEIAATPILDDNIPLLYSLVAICVLVGIEIFMSAVCLKSMKLRSALQGNAVVLINNGKLDLEQLKRLRYTVDDIMEALRQKDVFNIDDVQFAVAETNGSLSVLLKPEKRTLTVEDAGKSGSNDAMACVVVADGQIIRSDFKYCNMTEEKLKKLIKKTKINTEDIFLLTVDLNGNTYLIKKEKNK